MSSQPGRGERWEPDAAAHPQAPGGGTLGKGWPESPSTRAEGRDGGRRQEGIPASPAGYGPLPPEREDWMKAVGKLCSFRAAQGKLPRSSPRVMGSGLAFQGKGRAKGIGPSWTTLHGIHASM